MLDEDLLREVVWKLSRGTKPLSRNALGWVAECAGVIAEDVFAEYDRLYEENQRDIERSLTWNPSVPVVSIRPAEPPVDWQPNWRRIM